MKKILSLILVLCIAFIQSGIASAEELPKILNATQDLYDLGLMNGDEEGNLNDEKYVTRAEFAALVMRAMTQTTNGGKIYFKDVPADHWAADYIAFVAERGIIEGYGNDCFGPDDGVTLSQAVKMLLLSLGRAEEGFSYPMDYMMEAARCGLTVGLNLSHDSFLNRSEAAALVLNALYVPDINGNFLIEKLPCKTYYVSTDGDDSGDGSHLKPWRTLKKAAETATGYAIIYIEEGTYYETEPVVFSNSGESYKKPLTVKSRYGGNVVIACENAEEASLVKIAEGADFVTIKNLSFVSNDCSIKVENAENTVIRNNVFSGAKEALCIAGGRKTEIFGNTFKNQEKNCLRVYEGAQHIQIHSNEFFAGSGLENAAIVLGDSDSPSVKECVIWNNVIFDETEDTKATGLIYAGTENCQLYNNIIEGMQGGIVFLGKNIKPVFKNNIYSDCSDNAYIYTDAPSGIESDYNCFYNSYPQKKEAHSKLSNPYFVSRGTDWRLMSASPAAGSGTAVSPVFTYEDGESLALDMSDIDGNKREKIWHMGVHSLLSGETLSDEAANSGAKNMLLSLDFRKSADHMVASGGDWKAEGGALWQNSAAGKRTTICYDGGVEWSDYEYSADVDSSAAVEGNAAGIIFRSDIEMQNMYTFRFLSNDILEFAKWQNNSFASIEKWEYSFNNDTIYNLKVKAVGNTFTFYVNGEKVREVQDNSYSSGTVGLYCYREINRYDNMKVTSVK